MYNHESRIQKERENQVAKANGVFGVGHSISLCLTRQEELGCSCCIVGDCQKLCMKKFLQAELIK